MTGGKWQPMWYTPIGVTAPELAYDDYKDIDVKARLCWWREKHQHQAATPIHWPCGTKHFAPNQAEQCRKPMVRQACYTNGFLVQMPPIIQDLSIVMLQTLRLMVFQGTGKTYKETIRQIYKTQKPASSIPEREPTSKWMLPIIPMLLEKIFWYDQRQWPYTVQWICNHFRPSGPLGNDSFLIEGANDNNSSSAAMLGVAEALAKSKIKPNAASFSWVWTARKLDSPGSTYYTNHPLCTKG